MRSFFAVLALITTMTGCASIGFGGTNDRPEGMWRRANDALARSEFNEASALFEEISVQYPATVEGSESLYYLGVIRLDPRNPAWDPAPAQNYFEQYLGRGGDVRLFRFLEAQALLELASQLNLPPQDRVAGLQPPENPAPQPEQRVVAPARQNRELAAEVTRLRNLLSERDGQIKSQQEELDRIRRTLAAPRQ